MVESQIVKLNLTHNILSARIPEVRMDLNQTVASIKNLCEKKFGSDAMQMQLILQNAVGDSVVTMIEDDRPLGFYSPQEYWTIYCVDLNPNSLTKELEDLSAVEKYIMPDEDYDKLPSLKIIPIQIFIVTKKDTFRKFKKEFIAQHPELFQNKQYNSEDNYQQSYADNIQKGQRCKCLETSHRGTVKYVGKIQEIGAGYFVGIQLDEPFGKNNGIIKGTHYFDCPDNYGLILRPDKIQIGDFPELDLDDEI